MVDFFENSIGLPTMKRLEPYLFPRNDLWNFFVIACLSSAFSLLLTGRQIWRANWGIIDDHDVFRFLGPGLQLPLTEVWSTLLAKTEVGTLQGRFRPSYYTITLIETSLFGPNVHLWYLANTVGFALFLGSIWWFMRRFVGIWLSGVLTAYISLLPMWAGIWSRLGPSEIGGAACVGAMIFATYFVFFSDNPRTRTLSAIMLTLATTVLFGMKETFVPLAGGTLGIFLLAGIRKKLSLPVIAVLTVMVIASLAGMVVAVKARVAPDGTDYYARPIGPWLVIQFAGKGLFAAIQRTWRLYVISILFFGILSIIPRKPLRNWIEDFSVAVGAYGFLVVTYALQSALYRSGFPLDTRYDFPAMLLVPLTYCILACETSRQIRAVYSEQTINYAQFAAAAFLFFYFGLSTAFLDTSKPLAAAVRANIETTTVFYDEVESAVSAAQNSPDSPIILEAYGPGAYEAVFSLSTYLSALGARNHISVRLHPDKASSGKLYDGLQESLSGLQSADTGGFTPLRDSLASLTHGCISIGINGSPDASCSRFEVTAR